MSQEFVYIVERGLSDSSSDPQTEVVGVYSSIDLAEQAMLREAPHSGSVDRWTLNGGSYTGEPVMWRAWDTARRESVTRRPT